MASNDSSINLNLKSKDELMNSQSGAMDEIDARPVNQNVPESNRELASIDFSSAINLKSDIEASEPVPRKDAAASALADQLKMLPPIANNTFQNIQKFSFLENNYHYTADNTPVLDAVRGVGEQVNEKMTRLTTKLDDISSRGSEIASSQQSIIDMTRIQSIDVQHMKQQQDNIEKVLTGVKEDVTEFDKKMQKQMSEEAVTRQNELHKITTALYTVRQSMDGNVMTDTNQSKLQDLMKQSSDVIKLLENSCSDHVDSLNKLTTAIAALSEKMQSNGITAIDEPPEFLSGIRDHIVTLKEKLSAESLSADVFTDKAISLTEFLSIRHARSSTEKAEILLQIILRKGSQETYNSFLQSLKSKQNHLYRLLTETGYQLDDRHIHLIQGCYVDLLRNLYVDDGLIAHLFSDDVIDWRESRLIRAQPNEDQRAEQLLEMLSKKSSEKFEAFKTALHNTNQDHVVAMLQIAE